MKHMGTNSAEFGYQVTVDAGKLSGPKAFSKK